MTPPHPSESTDLRMKAPGSGRQLLPESHVSQPLRVPPGSGLEIAHTKSEETNVTYVHLRLTSGAN